MTEDFDNLTVAELKQRGVPPKQILAEMKRRGMSSREFIEAWSPKPPISSRVGSRSLRRRVVMAMYGSWLLIPLGFVLSFQARGSNLKLAIVSALALGAAAIVTASSVWLGRRTYVNSPQLLDSELDERLVQVKNQAYRTAFQIFGALVLIAWPLSLLLLVNNPGGNGITTSLLIVGGVALLITTLPTAIVAWREPDPTEPEPLGPSRPP
ncbi:MAG TPA: hypothetical protein VGU71_04430 [Candidatus Dormibacteraeota bacterium]|nr:hypothetical protein [Candidatus Dormibacteraeota bacterium]